MTSTPTPPVSRSASTVERFGLAANPAGGWSVDIRRQAPPQRLTVSSIDKVGVLASNGEVHLPVLHAATVPLPADRGDFGSGAVELLTPTDIFVALVEYGPEVADQGLFANQGLPRLAPSHFDPDNLQRPQPAVSAAQYFFSSGGRAFCLFTVIGAHRRRMATAPRAAAMVRGIRITPYRNLPSGG
ncbi:hypothetical protein [Piscicoccus intestinalis]|uniref:hypothetical protein n=1 Tax=Piscicoccus intestinalis TaxID=746033 RepID=UPI0008387E2D|nr:hypothetical protein [Piscicoccus intestinalis]